MHYYLTSPLQITHQTQGTLTYCSEVTLEIGTLVAVPVGKRIVPGVVLSQTEKPQFDTKLIDKIIDQTPLPIELVKLHGWMSEYYATHPVTVWQTLLPTGLMKKRRTKANVAPEISRKRTNIVLNDDQKSAVKKIVSSDVSQTFLLHGVTGSGKTAVYVEAIKSKMQDGRSSIVLVPEIALTSQLIAEFSHHFDDVIVTHSTMTESERHTTWLNILRSEKPCVVIGPRSALFMPIRKLGLIVIDECHEPSYKQESSPRYSALRAAKMLASYHNIPLVLGSATPSVTDYHLAKTISPDTVLRLPKVASASASKPIITSIDMTQRGSFTKNTYLSDTLIAKLSENIEAGHQSLLFHNRRGSASLTLCNNCGWSALCDRCHIPLALHEDAHHLRCHVCNYTARIPTSCPECSHADILHKGIGTKRIETELRKLFPSAVIARFDGDTVTGESVEKRYQDLYDGNIQIIIGTQVIAKGLDLPHLRLVGVAQADSGLSLPDFQSPERVFQLLAQVVGRVGRNQHATTVVVQSYQPSHPSIRYGLSQDFDSFFEHAIEERKRLHFPPFTHLMKLTCSYRSEKTAIHASRKLAEELRKLAGTTVQIFGPAPAFYERQRDTYRWQIILKSPKRSHLSDLSRHIPRSHWQHELDPTNLL